MVQSIEEAIHQKQFSDLRVKSDVNITFTASWLMVEKTRVLRPFGLTMQQFNVLRILKGAKEGPVSIRYITERMIDKASNASRLVDKLVEKEWVLRKICPMDRRQVEVSISPEGVSILENASQAVRNSQVVFNTLSDQEMELLNHLLDKIRKL